MSNEKLQGLIQALQEEMGSLTDVNEPTQTLLDQLEQNLASRRQDAPTAADNADDSPMGAALALEARFASHHPTAERIAREIIDTLHKMGI